MGPSCRENLQEGEKRRKTGLVKTCHLERDKLRCSKEDGREKERMRTGLLQAIVGIKAFGEKERGIACPASA